MKKLFFIFFILGISSSLYADDPCYVKVSGNTFSWSYNNKTDGTYVSSTINQPGTDLGFTFDIYGIDNSFNMEINGVMLATNEIQFQSSGTSGINIEFMDGDQYEANTPKIYNIDGDASNPMIRVKISPTGQVTLFGSKNSYSPLFPLQPKTGGSTVFTLNTIPWNINSNNIVEVKQLVYGPTKMNGYGYGKTIVSNPQVNAGSDVEVCDGETVTLTANNPDNATISWDNSVQDNTTFSPSNLGSNIYTVTATDETNSIYLDGVLNTCSSTDQVEVMVHELPIVNAGNDINVCEGNDVVLNGSGAGTGGIYNWDKSAVDGVEFTPPSGTTTYTVTGKDVNGCENTDQVDVVVNPDPTIDNMNITDPSCINDDGEIEITASGGTGSLTYEWFDENNQPIGAGNSINGLSGGDYSVSVTDDNGCIATDNGSLTDPPAIDDPSFILSDFCIGSSNAADNIVTPGGTFSIVSPTGDGTTINASTGEVSNGIVGVTYTVEYQTSGMCSNTSTEQITVLNSPDVSLTATPDAGIPPLNVEFENTTIGSSNFIWDFGEGETIHDNDILLSHLYNSAGVYMVILTGETNEGCIDTAMMQITMKYPPMEYIFPNIFTPNGDTQNDMFKLINAKGIKTFEIVILNRWGNVVFKGDKITFNWNGKIKNSGADCDDGTYFYKAKLKGFDNTEKTEHGFVQLSRDK